MVAVALWLLLILLAAHSTQGLQLVKQASTAAPNLLVTASTSSPADEVHAKSGHLRSPILAGRKWRLFGAKTGGGDQSAAAISANKYPLKVIIAGAPAAGKGTQCEVIKSRYGLVHLSTGDILRAAVKSGSPLGLKAKAFMDAGKLVPDDLIIDVVNDRLCGSDCLENGWLLDGFPRTKAQAAALHKAGMIPDCFVLLDVPEAVLVERVTGRRTDPVTGKIYHLRFNPPPADILARLVQRSDDTEEKIKVRYQDFKNNINAVQASYRQQMVAVDGSLAQSEVSKVVCKALDEIVSLRRGR